MSTQKSGNGSGKFNVHSKDMGGWIRVFTDALTILPHDAPVYLSLALTEWFRQRPHLRMRNIIPVARDGTTVELHAWYELGVFPDLSGHHPQPESSPE